MQRALIRLFRILPLGALYGCMALVIPFYMLFAKGFKASYNFYRMRMGYGPFKSFFHVYKNEYSFGQVVLDRFAAYAGKKFEMEVPRMDLFRELCAGEEGFIQLSSHVGCYEMVGYSLISPKPINALVFAGETATVMQNRALLFGETNVRMVPVSEDLSHIFALNNALADGEIASLPGDRVFLLRAFTKTYAIPGIRLGYGICPNADMLDRICSRSQFWNVSTPAQAAGLAALGCADWVLAARKLIREEKKYLTESLQALGITVFPSDANFLLLSGVPGLYDRLLARGILIRSCENYRGLSAGDCRIAVRTHPENEALINYLQMDALGL